MEEKNKDTVTIPRSLFENLLDDRSYLLALDKVLDSEIEKHRDAIEKVYEANLIINKTLWKLS